MCFAATLLLRNHSKFRGFFGINRRKTRLRGEKVRFIVEDHSTFLAAESHVIGYRKFITLMTRLC